MIKLPNPLDIQEKGIRILNDTGIRQALDLKLIKIQETDLQEIYNQLQDPETQRVETCWYWIQSLYDYNDWILKMEMLLLLV